MFEKYVFKGFYPKEIKKDKELYEYIKKLYVNRISEIMFAALLDMEINKYGLNLLYYGKTGSGVQTYYFSPVNLFNEDLQADVSSMNNVINLIVSEAKEQSANPKMAKAENYDDVVDVLIRELVTNRIFLDDFSRAKISRLFDRSIRKLENLRLGVYNENMDIQIATAIDTLHKMDMMGNRFLTVNGETLSQKLISMVLDNLKRECLRTGRTRFDLVRCSVRQNDLEECPSDYWDYMKQMERIKNCPQMW